MKELPRVEETRPTPRRSAVTIGVLSCVALAVRVFGLGRQGLWIDELERVTWAKGYEFDRTFDVLATETGARLEPSTLTRAVTVISRHNPPLNGTLLHLWLRLTADGNDAVIRLPSAIFSAASVPVTYLALRRRFGETAALFAAALVALSPYQARYAQEVNHYALGFLCVAVSFYYYLRYEEAPNLRDGIGWAVSGAAAFYAHYYCSIVVLFQWLAFLPGARARASSWLKVLGPPALTAALVLPYLPVVQSQMKELTRPEIMGAFTGFEYFVERLKAILTAPYLGDLGDGSRWFVALPVIALSAGVIGFALFRMDVAQRRLWLTNLVGPLALVICAFFVRKTNSILWPRYQLFFSFALFACLGVGLAALRRHAVPVSVAILGLFTAGHAHQYRLVLEDWRTVAANIDDARPSFDPVLVYHQNLVYSVARYLRGKNHLFGVGASPDLERTLGRIGRSSPGIWYVSSWPEPNDMESRVQAFLQSHYERCEKRPVNPGKIDLYLMRCTGARAMGEPIDATPSWRLAREGPLMEAANVESRNGTGIGGWAYSSAGISAIRVEIDGKTVADVPHPGIPRFDVSAAFAPRPWDLTEVSGFFVPLDVDEDAARRAHVFGVHADGTPFEMNGGAGE